MMIAFGGRICIYFILFIAGRQLTGKSMKNIEK